MSSSLHSKVRFVCAAVLTIAVLSSCTQLPKDEPSTSVTPTESLSVDPTDKVTQDSIVLSAKGIGQFLFGETSSDSLEEDVLAYLSPILGEPEIIYYAAGCGFPRGAQDTMATFGHLTINYSAEVTNRDTDVPRYMYSWRWDSVDTPQPPLVLDPSIPFGLSLDELRTQYRGGHENESMGSYHIDGIALIPPRDTNPNYVVYAGELNWCV